MQDVKKYLIWHLEEKTEGSFQTDDAGKATDKEDLKGENQNNATLMVPFKCNGFVKFSVRNWSHILNQLQRWDLLKTWQAQKYILLFNYPWFDSHKSEDQTHC